MKKLAKEKIESLTGQLNYTKQMITMGNLEAWEAKEYSNLVETLTSELTEAQKHYNYISTI